MSIRLGTIPLCREFPNLLTSFRFKQVRRRRLCVSEVADMWRSSNGQRPSVAPHDSPGDPSQGWRKSLLEPDPLTSSIAGCERLELSREFDHFIHTWGMKKRPVRNTIVHGKQTIAFQSLTPF